MNINQVNIPAIEASDIKSAMFELYKSLCCYGINDVAADFLANKFPMMLNPSTTPMFVKTQAIELINSEIERCKSFSDDHEAQFELVYNLGKIVGSCLSLTFVHYAVLQGHDYYLMASPDEFAKEFDLDDELCMDYLIEYVEDVYEFSMASAEGRPYKSTTGFVTSFKEAASH